MKYAANLTGLRRRLLPRAVMVLLAAALLAVAGTSPAGAQVSVRTERDEQTLRVAVNWRGDVDYTLSQTGTLVVVSFSRPVEQSFDAVQRANSDVFSDISLGGDRRVVVFRLRRELQVRGRKTGDTVLIEFIGVRSERASTRTATVELSVLRGDAGERRLIFDWDSPVEYRFAPEGRRATIVFHRRATLYLGEGARRLSQEGIALTAAPTGNSLAVTLVFERDVSLRAIDDGDRVIVEAVQARSRRADANGREDPSDTGQSSGDEVASVRAEQSDDGPVLVFDWPAKVSAAAFRRGGHIWLVFGSAARLELSAPREELRGQIDDMEQLVSDNGTVLRLRAGSTIRPMLERRNWEWRVTLFRGVGDRDQPSMTVTPDPDAAEGRGEVVINSGRTGPVLTVPDPDIGDTLIIVPVAASGWGVEHLHRFPTFRVLPSTQGIVVEPRADGITVTAAGQETRITGSRPLYLSPVGE